MNPCIMVNWFSAKIPNKNIGKGSPFNNVEKTGSLYAEK
jgi:hypothetical protein